MHPCRGYEGSRVGVLGLGRSGAALTRALLAGGAVPVCWDDVAAKRDAMSDLGAEIGDPAQAKIAGSLDLLAVSPGVPHLYPTEHPAISAAWAAGAPVDNDVGLFFASLAALGEAGPQVVAITGSNGKSTTTALIAHLLYSAARPCAAGGNLGRAVFDLPVLGAGGVYVLELSSYQTDLARRLSPEIAIFTNLSADHLDRHGGVGGYFAAKRRLFETAPHAVIGVDEPEGRFLAGWLMGRAGGAGVTRVATDPNRAAEIIAADARLVIGGEERANLEHARGLPGVHNAQNAALAWRAAELLGLNEASIRTGFDSFPGLAHRLQLIAEKDGVRFVNDSKATNADAAEKALRAYDKIRWIAGGRAKEGGLSSLSPLLGRVLKTYLIGECAAEFAVQLKDAPFEICGDLETAIRRAADEAEPGDTVLLAPAAASFDQFPDFEARGRAFEAVVREI